MSAHRFTSGEQFVWQGALFIVKRLLKPEQRVNLENLETGASVWVGESELVTALFAGEVIFSNQPDSHHREKLAPDLASFSADAVAVAHWRLQVIEPLLRLSEKEVTSTRVKQRVEEVRKNNPDESTKLRLAVSRASIYRWINAYRRSGNDIRTLLPKLGTRGGTGKSRLKQETTAIVDAILKAQCFRPEKVGLDDVLGLIAAKTEAENRLRSPGDPLPMPSRATLARRIEALDRQEIVEAQQGKRTASRKFAQIEKMQYPQLPYERVEIDHTRCDLLVIDEGDNLPLGRPTLTYCIDLATRYPLGYYLGFEPPSYFAVMECLYHTIAPKGNVRERYGTEHDWSAYGVPGTLVVDNGKEFIGQDLSDACEMLGTVLQQCPVMTPELKSGIERHFRSLNTGIFHTLPGTTFSNIAERGEYDSMKHACISLEELDKALTLFLVDIYAERFHRGLCGIPARHWDKAAATHLVPRLPPSKDELSILLGRVEWRVLQPSGIQFECLRYNDPSLGKLRNALNGEKVKFKYHPGDLSRIYVFDPNEKCYYEAPALDQEYTQGLSFWKHRLIRRLAAQEVGTVDLAGLGRARQKIQEMVDRARSRKRTATRSKVARWDGKAPHSPEQKKSTGATETPTPKALDSGTTTSLDTTLYEFDYNLPPSRRDE
jgi:putative transposase